MMDAANLKAAMAALTRKQAHSIMAAVIKQHGLSDREIFEKIRVYNNWPQLNMEELPAHDD